MLKIVALPGNGNTATLRVEGRVIGPWVDELRRSCDQILSAGTTVTLDVAEVDFVERDGVRLLKDLMASGVAVVNCSAFVSEQLKAPSRC
jgi:STAS domain-containing protein